MSPGDRIAQMQGTPWPNGSGKNWNDTFRSMDTSSVAGFRFRDGPRGVNLDAPLAPLNAAATTTVIGDSQMPTGGKSTSFPVAMARGATFDLELEYKIGQAIGDEMVAAKQSNLLAPTVNILRHPLWGRAQETYGEDVFLLGRMGSVFTVGVQEFVPACAKHYAANNIENGRETLNVTMDEQTLREIYARHFEMIIKDGGVACIMAAYNQVNGTKSSLNKKLLTDILRTDFGFKGFVLTDWWAMPGGNAQDPSSTSTLKTGASDAVSAGLDMELPWNLYFSQLGAITDATSGATVSTAQIKTAATRIYEQKLRFKVDKFTGGMGLKAATTTFSGGTISGNGTATDTGLTTHTGLAYNAALEGMVLLKNEKALPIASTTKTVAVIGASIPFTLKYAGATTTTPGTVDFSKDMRQGDVGSSRVIPTSSPISPVDGIKGAAPTGVTVVSGNAATAASGADVIVVMAGLTARDEGEEYTGAGDRTTCDLDGKENTGKQNQLIADVAALGKPMIVVLEGGSVINVEPWLAKAAAVVMAWYPGQMGGKALGDLLWGKANFSGKLPISWPVSCTADLPTFSGGGTTALDYDLGYRYFDRNASTKTPRYYFGHGLSYTTFQYSNASSGCSDVTKDGNIVLNVTVTNTGTVDGTETVFAFASFPGSTARRSVKELKGFTRATVKAGQSQQVSIYVRASDLKYWNSTTNSWTIDTGNVDFLIGPNADSTKLLKVTVPIK